MIPIFEAKKFADKKKATSEEWSFSEGDKIDLFSLMIKELKHILIAQLPSVRNRLVFGIG